MNLNEFKAFVLENNQKGNYKIIDEKVKKLEIPMVFILSDLSHNYAKIGKLYSMILKQDKDKYQDYYLLQSKHDGFYIKNQDYVEKMFRKEQFAIINKHFEKHPKIKKTLENFLRTRPLECKLNTDMDIAKAISVQYIKRKNLYAKESLNFLKFNLQTVKGWEVLYDEMQKAEIRHDNKAFAESFFSNKNKYLMTKETYNYCQLLKESGLERKELQEGFFNKLAKYKTSEELNKELKEFVDRNNGWSKINLETRIKNNNAKILFNDNNKLLIEIENYEQIKKLGSRNWCIVTDEGFFKQYIQGLNRQFILYDFNKEYKDPEFMIGVTTDAKGLLQVAHDNNDVKLSEFRENLIGSIITKTAPKQSTKQIEKRAQKEIESNVNKTVIVDLIIYYNLIDFGLKWIKDNKINLGEDAIRFSLFLIQYDYKKYLDNLNYLPTFDLFHLNKVFIDLDEVVEIERDVAIKILKTLNKDVKNVVEKLIPMIKKSDDIEYFNIIEGIKNCDPKYL